MAILTRALLLLLLLWSSPAYAQAPEYQVKAAMLYNFALFVEWPDRVFPSTDSPFAACVLGESPFQSWLRHELHGLRVNAHPVEVRLLDATEQARECALVFISRSEQDRLANILAQLRDAGVLTVSDIDGFCDQGGMVGLVMEGNKVRFDVNAEAAAESGLTISSRLLRVARDVKGVEVR